MDFSGLVLSMLLGLLAFLVLMMIAVAAILPVLKWYEQRRFVLAGIGTALWLLLLCALWKGLLQFLAFLATHLV